MKTDKEFLNDYISKQISTIEFYNIEYNLPNYGDIEVKKVAS